MDAEALRRDSGQPRSPRSHEPVPTITDDGLVLGRTVLAKMVRDAFGHLLLAIDGAEDRILALLAVAYGKPTGPKVLDNIRRAAAAWHDGETCLALIHLARAGLPPLSERDASYRLALADRLLADGLPPSEPIKACGLDATPIDAEKAGYNRNEPRIPAGNGRGSGNWTTADASPKPSPTKVNPGEPHPEFVSYTPVHGLPDDAVAVTMPDGRTIADKDSDTKKLMAPPHADFRAVYAAGLAIAELPYTEQYPRARAAIAQEGIYDFQRDVPKQKFYDAYVHAANYAVGVYMAGAGYSLFETRAFAKLYALRNSSNFDSQDQLGWIGRGWEDGKSGVWR